MCGKRHTVALVDEHPIVAVGVKAMVKETSNFDFAYHCTHGKAFLQQVEQQPIDLLLLDLNLPDIDYTSMLQAVKSAAPDTKIIIFTAYKTCSLVKTVLQSGIDGYLLKSTPPEEFKDCLKSIVSTDEVYIGSGVSMTKPATPLVPRMRDDFERLSSLSRREKEILSLIGQGYTSLNISKTLYISKYTVETHRKNMLRKLDFNNSNELVRFAVQQGIIS